MREDFPLFRKGLPALRQKAKQADGFAERLKQIKTKLGITQEEMAKRLGIDLKTYGRSERGERAMAAGELAQIRALGIDLNWLLTGQRGMEESPAAAFVHLDPELMGRIIDGLATLYKEENQRLPPLDQGRIAAEIYSVLASMEDEADRPVGLRYALEARRMELRRAAIDPGSSKLRA